MLNLEEIRASEVDGHYGGFGLGGEHACYCNEIAYLMSRVESLENLVGVLAERRGSLPPWARELLAPYVRLVVE